MSGFLGLRSFPGSGCQLAHSVAWPLAELWKHVPEVVSEVDIQPPASFHNGGDGCDLRSSFRAADVQPIPAAQDQRADPSLAPIIINFQGAVLQILFPTAPLSQSVVTSLGQLTSGRHLLTHFHQAVFE